jgi:membrane fusion protein, multidrug efflux system
MKSTIYSRLLIVITLAGLLAACSAASNDTDKKARLEKLKSQQADLSKEVKQLEDAIAKENPGTKSNAKPKEVAILELAPRKFDHFVQTQGSVESENNIQVSARSGGVVTQVFVTEGQQVSKGQILAQIDNSVVARNIESQKAQLELTTSIYNRQKNLWEQKIGTEVQYLQAKTNKESLEKQLESLQEQNDMFRIKSPINGTVDEVKLKVGENATPGAPAFRVVNGNDLKLTARVSEAYVTNIKKGNSVLVNIPELDKDIDAKITFVGNNIDPLSRTFNVEVKLPSLPNLRPNMTGTIRVIFKSEKDVIVVPVNTIQSLNEEKVVYVAETKGKQTIARKRVVTIAGVYDNEAQVEGLKAGDKLISVGYQGLNDGDPIKL